jgi:hypothetical protein
MKKVYRIVILFLILNLSSNSFSQGNLTINLGASIPISEYSETIGIGAGLGLQYIYPLSDNGLGIFVGIESIYNGLKESITKEIQDINQDINFRWQKILNFPLSTGLNYNHRLNEKFTLFANGGLTFTILKLTDQVVTSPNDKSTIKTNLTSSFGVKFGVGIEFKEKITLSLNYLGFNKYDLHKKAEYSGTTKYFDSKLKVDMGTLCLGYRF